MYNTVYIGPKLIFHFVLFKSHRRIQ